MSEFGGARREPLLNLPPVIGWLIGLLLAIQGIVGEGPRVLSETLFDLFAFVPARFSYLFAPNAVLEHIVGLDRLTGNEEGRLAIALDAGWSAYLTPLTYAFLHGDWTHVCVNAVSLAAFGTPVARRLGPGLFLIFAALCALAGALLHLALHTYDLTAVVGASAAISGTIGAIVRFAFTPGAQFSARKLVDVDRRGDVAPLTQLSSNRQALVFLVVWLGMNALLGAFPEAIGVSGAIAWEAHLGGFFIGLMAYGIFDRAARRA